MRVFSDLSMLIPKIRCYSLVRSMLSEVAFNFVIYVRVGLWMFKSDGHCRYLYFSFYFSFLIYSILLACR